jgi:hypothetical protein
MNKLFHSSEKKYGTHYNEHLITQYQIYCDTLEKATVRRQEINRLFILLNTGIFSVLGILLQQGSKDKTLLIATLPIVLIGFYVSYLQWKFLIMYKDLITAKFNIIYELEESLPLGLYSKEWEEINTNKHKYKSFSETEKHIPIIFSLIYILILLLIFFKIYYT